MQKLADIENLDLSSLEYAYEHIISFDDCTETSLYTVLDMFFNAVKDGFRIEFYSIECYSGPIPVIQISKDGHYEEFEIYNLLNRKNVILFVCNFIKSVTKEINEKIDKEQNNE